MAKADDRRNPCRVSFPKKLVQLLLSSAVKEEPNDSHSKALRINLDPRWYGTFAEIGAGQEVVRWFFRVGGAAGTVAKSMSAYDMKVSDAIDRKSTRLNSSHTVISYAVFC